MRVQLIGDDDTASVRIENDTLRCPKCNSSYLHHSTVSVFTRSQEDAASLVTSVGAPDDYGQGVERLISSTVNPSSRRNGIAIRFSCENCDLYAELTIAQHKGETFVEWRG